MAFGGLGPFTSVGSVSPMKPKPTSRKRFRVGIPTYIDPPPPPPPLPSSLESYLLVQPGSFLGGGGLVGVVGGWACFNYTDELRTTGSRFRV